MRICELFVPKKTGMYIRQLYDSKEAPKRIRSYGNKKAMLFFATVAVSVVISVPLFVTDHIRSSSPVTEIQRNENGGGPKTAMMRVVTEDGYEEDLSLEISERKYTDKEIAQMSEDLDKMLPAAILGKNASPDNVMYDLILENTVKGFPFKITWKSDHPLILGIDGRINAESLKKEDPDDEGVSVRLCATLKYRDYSEDKYFFIVLRQKQKTADEERAEIIKETVDETGDASETEDVLVLPDKVQGRKITFYETQAGRGWAVIFVGIMTAFLIGALKDAKIKDEADERRRQMECDHPVILNRYMLYYMAGMNPRAIWYEICRRYEQERADKRYGKRYAYEEMIAARNRMEEGCGELAAYDGFAARCDDVRFRSFASFVKQAVVTGGAGLGGILYEEMDKARRERIGRVKMAASEAETKLLLPMFMMLAVVLVIVMVPAFMSLN